MIDPWVLFAIALFLLVVQIIEVVHEYDTYKTRVKRTTKPLTLLTTALVAALSLRNGISSYQRSLPRDLHHYTRDVTALSKYKGTDIALECDSKRDDTTNYFTHLISTLRQAGWSVHVQSCGGVFSGMVDAPNAISYDTAADTFAAKALVTVLEDEGERADLKWMPTAVVSGGPGWDSGGSNSSSDILLIVHDR